MGDGEGAERAGFVGGSFSSSVGGKRFSLPEPFVSRAFLPSSPGSHAALCQPSAAPVPPREQAAAPQFLCCDITELCSPEALNGVFVTVCGMFQMLRGPHY